MSMRCSVHRLARGPQGPSAPGTIEEHGRTMLRVSGPMPARGLSLPKPLEIDLMSETATTLYERLGRREGITRITRELMKNHLANPLIKARYEKSEDLPRVERRAVEFFCAGLVDPARLPRERVAEVSRLAVVSAYRRRKSDQATAGTISPDDFGSPERPRFPYVTVGLYLGMIAQAQRFGIDTLFVLTEPRLARHLSLLGVQIKRIGGPVEHRGRRVPSMMSVPGIVSGFGPFVRPLYEQIAGEVTAGYGSALSARIQAPDATSIAASPWGAPHVHQI